MPSPFEAAWAARSSDLLVHFNEMEAFLLEPQTRPTMTVAGGLEVPDVNQATVADPGRPVLAVQAVFLDKGAPLHAHGRSMADSTTRPIVAESPIAILQLDAIGMDVERDDVLTRTRTGKRYAVTKVVPQQFGRGFAHLAEVG